MSRSDSVADIAYLKRLAQAGRGRPAPVLPLMATFGAAYGTAFLLIYANVMLAGPEGLGRLGLLSVLARWSAIGAHLVFLAALLWTGWRIATARGRGLSRSAVAIWSGAFVALITVVAAFRLYARGEPATDLVYTSYMLPPVLLALWGAAWWASAILADRPWLFGVSLASIGAAIAAALIGNSLHLLLLAGLCLFGLAFAPAMLLMRAGRD